MLVQCEPFYPLSSSANSFATEPDQFLPLLPPVHRQLALQSLSSEQLPGSAHAAPPTPHRPRRIAHTASRVHGWAGAPGLRAQPSQLRWTARGRRRRRSPSAQRMTRLARREGRRGSVLAGCKRTVWRRARLVLCAKGTSHEAST
eukprot:1743935-Pleurochrysis_carterae.AAC.5